MIFFLIDGLLIFAEAYPVESTFSNLEFHQRKNMYLIF